MLEQLKGKRVLVTGHTGFKGTWMCETLLQAGAEVTGYALQPPTDPSLFQLCGYEKLIHSVNGDVRDLEHLKQVFAETRPDAVIHMAAQPIVRSSYDSPVETYEINVMGTVNVLEAVRLTDSVRSVVNVTTDKVYKNREWSWGYRENEELNGYDPYSNSKSCSELVTDSYRNSFFSSAAPRTADTGAAASQTVSAGDAADRAAEDQSCGRSSKAISTMRAGNVIGGGDFAKDRIIPDCIRAACDRRDIVLRNPHSTRPYQHVLEPVTAYLMVAAAQLERPELAGSYNVGPDEADCRTTGGIADLFCDTWQRITGETVRWISQYDGGPHEANFLKLDCSKLKTTFGWKPRWHVEDAMEEIVNWCAYWRKSPGTMRSYIAEQVSRFLTR